jgi:hypothetical protein
MTEHRPEPEELKGALAAAAQMRLAGEDPHHVARWLNHYHRRCQGLEALLRVIDRYLRFGMPEHELSEMRLLVSRLRESELAADASVDVDSTLPL